jgi:hypothetical protein
MTPERPTQGTWHVVLHKLIENVFGILTWSFRRLALITCVLKKAVEGICSAIHMIVDTPNHITAVACDEDILDLGVPDKSVKREMCLEEATVSL